MGKVDSEKAKGKGVELEVGESKKFGEGRKMRWKGFGDYRKVEYER